MHQIRFLPAALLAVSLCPTAVFAQRSDDPRLEKTAIELGVLESGDQLEIRSPLQSQIISLVPEGVAAQKGDELVRLDTSQIEEAVGLKRIDVATARARVQQAKANYEQARIELFAGMEKVKLSLNVAKLGLARFSDEDGEHNARVRVATATLTLAKERLKTVEALKALIQKDPSATAGDLLKASLDVLEAKTSLVKAEAEQRLVSGPVMRHEVAVLKLAVASAELDMKSMQVKSERQLAQAKSDLAAREATLQVAQHKLDRQRDLLRRGVIRAPRDGTVVYATAGGRSRVVIEEGVTVRERQPILRLVNPKSLRLRVKVRESRISRVKVGQPVKIRLDAFPDRVFNGKVIKVNAHAEPSSWLNNGVKNFIALVSIDAGDVGLKIGLTAAAEIDLSK